jgi:hypothetical protein
MILFVYGANQMITAGAKYFVSADGKKLGPFTGQQIRTKLFRKTITADDYVWHDGLGDSCERTPSDLVTSCGEVAKRFRFLNAELFGTILAMQPFNRFPLVRARNRLQDAV